MWAVNRRPVGSSRVPAAIPVRSASAAFQNMLEPQSPQNARLAWRLESGLVDPAQCVSVHEQMVVLRRRERSRVAAPPAALDAVAENDVAERPAHLVGHGAAEAATGRAHLGHRPTL